MEEKGILELKESSVIADDIEKKIRTVGVRGLDFEKAKETIILNNLKIIEEKDLVKL
jgi:hypothetical protein